MARINNTTFCGKTSIVECILDSVNPRGVRLTTLKLTYPRCVHGELLTHRAFSRNSASSRAKPLEVGIQDVEIAPFIPLYVGKNQKGMQASQELSPEDKIKFYDIERELRNATVSAVKHMAKLGVAKQHANRYLEPFSNIDVLVSSTDWDNFFSLRISELADPLMLDLGTTIKEALTTLLPTPIEKDEWHLPYVLPSEKEEETLGTLQRISVARCARVTYSHRSIVPCITDDISLHNTLKQNRHMSPFEHCAKALNSVEYSGNFRGFLQYRKTIEGESGQSLAKKGWLQNLLNFFKN